MICSNKAYAGDQERYECPCLHNSSLLGLSNISLFKMIRSDIVTPLLGILLSRPLIDHCFLSREDTLSA